MLIRALSVVTLLAGMVHTTGCSTTGPSGQAEIDTWTGATVEQLYLAYGTPAKSIEQVDGNTIVTFDHSRTDSSTPYYCTVRYIVDPAGIVLSGTFEGNIGGCNRLIQAHETTP